MPTTRLCWACLTPSHLYPSSMRTDGHVTVSRAGGYSPLYRHPLGYPSSHQHSIEEFPPAFPPPGGLQECPPLGSRGRSKGISGCPVPVWPCNKYVLIIATCQPLGQALVNSSGQDQVGVCWGDRPETRPPNVFITVRE